MATSFFGGSFFDGEFFNQGTSTRPRPDDGPGRKTLTVKGRSIYKPTGFLDRPVKQGRKSVNERVVEAEQIAREVATEIVLDVPRAPPPITEMTMSEVEREIGMLLRKKMRTEEDELILLLLMAASAAG